MDPGETRSSSHGFFFVPVHGTGGTAALCVPQPLYTAEADIVQRRALPVVIALERYKNRHGIYPRTLSELVPEDLVSIPSPGLWDPGGQGFLYTVAGPNTPFHFYELRASTPDRGDELDSVVYLFWPERDYPDYLYGVSVRRIGSWASLRS